MDIEEFFDQPYTDRQLVEFVDDSKLEKKSLLVAILEKDKLFLASAAHIVGGLDAATEWISIPIGLAASGVEKLLNKSEPNIPKSEPDNLEKLSNRSEPDIPNSESDNLLTFSPLKKIRERLLTSIIERKYDIKLIRSTRKKGVVITLIGRSYVEHFKLPPTHPRNHTIYVAHPVVRQEYTPLADFHRSTFENKFNELLRLLSHLGAKTIEVYHMRGWGAKFAAHLDVPLSTSNAVDVDAQRYIEQTLLYKAVLQGHTPSMPEGLKWYDIEPKWQQIVDQRLHHELQAFSLHYTYKDDFGINMELGSKLKKAGFGLGGNFEGLTATEWRVTGEF